MLLTVIKLVFLEHFVVPKMSFKMLLVLSTGPYQSLKTMGDNVMVYID